MDIPDLAAAVPAMLIEHARLGWELLSGRVTGEDLILRIHAIAQPEREAVVRVFGGAEVFFTEFMGHDDVNFAYENHERLEALQDRIDLAAAAIYGPTRLTQWRHGKVVIRSQLVIDPDGPSPRYGVDVRRPWAWVLARATFRRISHQVVDVPALRFPQENAGRS